MNNEPVAWMETYKGEPNNLDWDKNNLYCEGEFHNVVPLYTHPVKEQDTDCQYCKQGCIRCDARKQLTDEEIKQIWLEFDARDTHDWFIAIARAILRKAQEK